MVAWSLVHVELQREVQRAALDTLERRLFRVDRALRDEDDTRRIAHLTDRRQRILRAIEAAWRLV